MSKYVYPVILTPEEDGGYSADFPDIESCYTCGDDLADTLEMAKDVLALVLRTLEDDKKEIPKPSLQTAFDLVDGQILSLISADTMEYRKLYDSSAIKKTLTIPRWLNTIAENENVNFSQTLQKALKEELQLSE